MKTLPETQSTRLVTMVVFLVVLVALCFSIGEGLRLTPFPVSTLTIDEASDRQFSAAASQKVALYKYGPLDVPPQNQKRNKRHIAELVDAPSGIVRQLPACLYGCGDQQPPHIGSALFVSRLAGRDPPFSS